MKIAKLSAQCGFALLCALWPAWSFAGHTTGTLKGNLVSQTAGACNDGYSGLCPSGSCICDVFVGTISGKPIGKGTAELEATIDQGAALSSGPTCFPVFAVLAISTTVDTEVINVTGSDCSGGGVVDSLSGGFGIDQSLVGAAAWGKLSGTVNLSTGSGIVKYSGTTF
jgi:hypothetical protein